MCDLRQIKQLQAQLEAEKLSHAAWEKQSLLEYSEVVQERDAFESDVSTIAQHNIELMQERDALGDALELLYSWANNWDSEFMNDPDWKNRDLLQIQEALTKVKENQP